ncbi:FliM/FliN family flagellar motor switch protein [Parasphingorhabdus sp. JC815]|uniref:FliM/FliN family flagellar motor switch protein n=1 Tax=Parasphingorhabdus sp. JC815 TaxID=3232140 RepID=UPI0034574B6C
MAKIVSYSFAEKPAHRLTDLSPLRRISDRYVSAMENAIEHIAGQPVQVVAEEIEFTAYSRWSSALDTLSSLSVFRLYPLRGTVILRLEEGMINHLINVYFGGAPAPSVRRTKEGFRPTEMQLIDRLAPSLIDHLCDIFSGYGPMKPVFQRHESSPSLITGYKEQEQVMRQPFRITADAKNSWQAELIYSSEAAASAIEFVQNKDIELPAASDPFWQQRWAENLKQIYLPLRSILAQPTMRMPELFELKPGDVIPITPQANPPLFVANRRFATGTLGEKNGCAAFRIEHIEQGDKG